MHISMFQGWANPAVLLEGVLTSQNLVQVVHPQILAFCCLCKKPRVAEWLTRLGTLCVRSFDPKYEGYLSRLPYYGKLLGRPIL